MYTFFFIDFDAISLHFVPVAANHLVLIDKFSVPIFFFFAVRDVLWSGGAILQISSPYY